MMTKKTKHIWFFGLLLAMPFLVLGQETETPLYPEMQILNLTADQNTVRGEVFLKNPIKSPPINNVAYTVILQETNIERKEIKDGIPRTMVTSGATISVRTEKEFFAVAPGEEKTTSFSISYPEAIPSGAYRLEVRLATVSGRIVISRLAEIKLSGSGRFLRVDRPSCGLLLAGQKFQPNDGPNVYPGEKLKISCRVSNPSQLALTAVPTITSTVFSVFGSVSEDFNKIVLAPIIFAAGETKEVILEISAPENPQTYQAELLFKDQASEAVVSPIALFRWVVKGKAARITDVELDKDSYKRGDKAQVAVSFFGSPDLFWRLSEESFVKADPTRFAGSPIENLVLKANLVSERGELCGKGEKSYKNPVDSELLQTRTIEIPIEITCRDPRVEVLLLDGNETLASIDYITRSIPLPAAKITTKIQWYLLIGLALLGIFYWLYWFLKKKRSQYNLGNQ